MSKLLKYLGLFFPETAKSIVKDLSAKELRQFFRKRENVVVFGRISGIDELYSQAGNTEFRKVLVELRKMILEKAFENEGIIFEFPMSHFVIVFCRINSFGTDIHQNAFKFSKEILVDTASIFNRWSQISKIVEYIGETDDSRKFGISIGVDSGKTELFEEHNRLIIFGSPVIWAKRLSMCPAGDIAVNNVLRYRMLDNNIEENSKRYFTTFVVDFDSIEINTPDFPTFTGYKLRKDTKQIH